MLLTEPIVLFLSLLSGFADALIFFFFEGYGYVFQQWSFTPTEISFVLVTLAGSYVTNQGTGPPLHWAGEVVASVLIGIANFAIYYATIDYMIAVYGPYTASATGGNGFMRDFLAGLCSFYTGPMYRDLGVRNSYLVLFWLAVLFWLPGYVLYFKGSAIRARSKFANELALEKEGQEKSSNVMEIERVGAHD
jgi:hypothetical protein